MATKRRTRVDWDVIADVRLPELQPADARELRTGGRHDSLEFRGVEAADVDLSDGQFLDCRIAESRFENVQLRGGRLSSCVLQDVTAIGVDGLRSVWADVVLRTCRVGAFLAHGSDLTSVTVEGGRWDYVNLRGATLTQVQILDCRIGELDLTAATLTDVRVLGSVVERLVVRDARLIDVDLRGAAFSAMDGVGSLSGALISEGQLAQLAPALAEHVGIRVAT